MAHTITQLATQIDFQCEEVAWAAGIAELTGWRDQGIGGPIGVLRIIEPPQYANLTGPVEREDLPKDLRAKVPIKSPPGRFSQRVHKIQSKHRLEVLLSDVPPRARTVPLSGRTPRNVPLRRVNGWKMREDFLRLKRNTGALVDFLNRYGAWNFVTSPFPNHGDWKPEIVLPDQIWYISNLEMTKATPVDLPIVPPGQYDAQNTFSKGLIEPRWWFDKLIARPYIDTRPEFPHLVINAARCFDVIRVSITIDHLRGSKFRVCARPDCGMPFAIKSQHRRIYCRQYCGHLESIRKQRREKSIATERND